MTFAVRRVVTGHDATGQAVIVSDGAPPHLVEAPNGTAVADLWALAAPPSDPAEGFDPPEGFAIEPPVGGMWWRIIRLPLPDQSLPREQQFLHQQHDDRFSSARPGMHATPTLDLMTVVAGEIELEVENGCVRLGPTDCVVQRGTQHRWRVVGGEPCTYAVALFGFDPAAMPPPALERGVGPRLVVTGHDADGRSIIVSDRAAPERVSFDGGPMPIEWAFGGAAAGRGTLALNLVLAGPIELGLPGRPAVSLGAGDVVVQRGTDHRWRTDDAGPGQRIAILIGAPLGEKGTP